MSFCESEALSSELRLSEGEVLLPKVKTDFLFNFLTRPLVKEGSASEGEITLGGSNGDRLRRDPGYLLIHNS